MDIIDAHIHFNPEITDFAQLARQAGHEYSAEHLREEFHRLHIGGAIVMGNGALEPEKHAYPDFLHYCIGLDGDWLETIEPRRVLELVEANLRRSQCVGVKLYPGYSHIYVSDRRYAPLYELAAQYDKAVAIHTGATAGGMGLLKYSHPLTVDEAAVQFPQTRFVMCHFGNPWLTDAAAVMEKNENVFADLSGLLEGRFDLDSLLEENSGYFDLLRTWMGYAGGYHKLMYGTDWPLVNLEQYLACIARIVPEQYHEDVFCQTAKQVYGL